VGFGVVDWPCIHFIGGRDLLIFDLKERTSRKRLLRKCYYLILYD